MLLLTPRAGTSWTWDISIPFSLFQGLSGFEQGGSPLWRINFYARGYPDGPDAAMEASAWSPTGYTLRVTGHKSQVTYVKRCSFCRRARGRPRVR